MLEDDEVRAGDARRIEPTITQHGIQQGDEMLNISISSELAAEHSRFINECAERGHRVQVFEPGSTVEERPGRLSGRSRRGLRSAGCDGRYSAEHG